MKDKENTNHVSFYHEISQRISLLIDEFCEGNRKNFAEKIGVKQQSVNRLFNVDKRSSKYPKPSDEIIEAILNSFTNINRIWLITGVGNKEINDRQDRGTPKTYYQDDGNLGVIMERLALYEEKIDFYKERIEKLEEENQTLKKDQKPTIPSKGISTSK